MVKLKILHVEDDLDILEISKMSLELIGGFELHQCASGKQALEEAADFAPDVFLLDMMMPEMSGDMVLKRFRDIPGLQEIPAIFMTARAQGKDVASFKELGAIGVILKPFDPVTLPEQIKAMLGP